jgi:hypothetical protein
MVYIDFDEGIVYNAGNSIPVDKLDTFSKKYGSINQQQETIVHFVKKSVDDIKKIIKKTFNTEIILNSLTSLENDEANKLFIHDKLSGKLSFVGMDTLLQTVSGKKTLSELFYFSKYQQTEFSKTINSIIKGLEKNGYSFRKHSESDVLFHQHTDEEYLKQIFDSKKTDKRKLFELVNFMEFSMNEKIEKTLPFYIECETLKEQMNNPNISNKDLEKCVVKGFEKFIRTFKDTSYIPETIFSKTAVTELSKELEKNSIFLSEISKTSGKSKPRDIHLDFS